MTIGILFYNSLIAGIVLSLGAVMLKPVYLKRMREKHKQELLVQFRDLLYSISSSVSSGRNMVQSLEESLDFWNSTYDDTDTIIIDVKAMISRIRNGGEKDTEVFREFAELSGLDDIRDFAAVYENCKSTGGNLITAINRATDIIGDKITLERELRSQMAEKVFEGRIVALAPFAIIVFLRFSSEEYLEPLYETSEGRTVMTICLGLIALAGWMIGRISRIEL